MELHHLLSLGEGVTEGRSSKAALTRRIECIAAVAKKVVTMNQQSSSNANLSSNLTATMSTYINPTSITASFASKSPNTSMSYGALGEAGPAGSAIEHAIDSAVSAFDGLSGGGRGSVDSSISKAVLDHPSSTSTSIRPEMILQPRDRFMSYVYCGMSDGSVAQFAVVLSLVASSSSLVSNGGGGPAANPFDHFEYGTSAADGEPTLASASTPTASHFSALASAGGGANKRIAFPADAASVLDKDYLHHIAPYRHKVSFQEVFTSPLQAGEGAVTFLQHIAPPEPSKFGGNTNNGDLTSPLSVSSPLMSSANGRSMASTTRSEPKLIALRGSKLMMLNATTFNVEPTFRDFRPIEAGVSLCCVATPAPTTELGQNGEPSNREATGQGNGLMQASGKIAAIVKKMVICMTFVGTNCYTYYGSGTQGLFNMLTGDDSSPTSQSPQTPASGVQAPQAQQLVQQPIMVPEGTTQIVWHKDSIILGGQREYSVYNAQTGHLLDVISIDRSLIKPELAAAGSLPSLSVLPESFHLKWLAGMNDDGSSNKSGTAADGNDLLSANNSKQASKQAVVEIEGAGSSSGTGGGAVAIRQPFVTLYDPKGHRPIEEAKHFVLKDGEEAYDVAFNFPFMAAFSASGPDIKALNHQAMTDYQRKLQIANANNNRRASVVLAGGSAISTSAADPSNSQLQPPLLLDHSTHLTHVAFSSLLNDAQQAPFVLPLPCHVNTRNNSVALPKHPLTVSNKMTATSPSLLSLVSGLGGGGGAGGISHHDTSNTHLDVSSPAWNTPSPHRGSAQPPPNDGSIGGTIAGGASPIVAIAQRQQQTALFHKLLTQPGIKTLSQHLHQPNFQNADGTVGAGASPQHQQQSSPGQVTRTESTSIRLQQTAARLAAPSGASSAAQGFRTYFNVDSQSYIQHPMLMNKAVSVPMATFFTVSAAPAATMAAMIEAGVPSTGASPQGVTSYHNQAAANAAPASNRDLFVAVPLPAITIILQLALSGAYGSAISHYENVFPYFPTSIGGGMGGADVSPAAHIGGSVAARSMALSMTHHARTHSGGGAGDLSLSMGLPPVHSRTPSTGSAGLGYSRVALGSGGPASASSAGRPYQPGGPGGRCSITNSIKTVADILYAHDLAPWNEYSTADRYQMGLSHLYVVCGAAAWRHQRFAEALRYLEKAAQLSGGGLISALTIVDALSELKPPGEKGGTGIGTPRGVSGVPVQGARPRSASFMLAREVADALLSPASLSAIGKEACTILARLLIRLRNQAFTGQKLCVLMIRTLKAAGKNHIETPLMPNNSNTNNPGGNFGASRVFSPIVKAPPAASGVFNRSGAYSPSQSFSSPTKGGVGGLLSSTGGGNGSTSQAPGGGSGSSLNTLQRLKSYRLELAAIDYALFYLMLTEKGTFTAREITSLFFPTTSLVYGECRQLLDSLSRKAQMMAATEQSTVVNVGGGGGGGGGTGSETPPIDSANQSGQVSRKESLSLIARIKRSDTVTSDVSAGGDGHAESHTSREGNTTPTTTNVDFTSGGAANTDSNNSLSPQGQLNSSTQQHQPNTVATKKSGTTALTPSDLLFLRCARFESLLMASHGMLRAALALCRSESLVAEAVVPLLWACYPPVAAASTSRPRSRANSGSGFGSHMASAGTVAHRSLTAANNANNATFTENTSVALFGATNVFKDNHSMLMNSTLAAAAGGLNNSLLLDTAALTLNLSAVVASNIAKNANTAIQIDPRYPTPDETIDTIGLFAEHLPWMLAADAVSALEALTTSGSSVTGGGEGKAFDSFQQQNTEDKLMSSLASIDREAQAIIKEMEEGEAQEREMESDLATAGRSAGYFDHADSPTGGGGFYSSALGSSSQNNHHTNPFVFSPPPHNAIIPIFLRYGFRGGPLFDYLKFLIDIKKVRDPSVHTLHAINLIEMVGIVARAVFAPAGEVLFDDPTLMPENQPQRGRADSALGLVEDDNAAFVVTTPTPLAPSALSEQAKVKPATNDEVSDWRRLLSETTIRFSDDGLSQPAGSETGVLGSLRSALLAYLQLPQACYDADIILCRLSNCSTAGWWLAPSLVGSGESLPPLANSAADTGGVFFSPTAATAYLSAPRLTDILNALQSNGEKVLPHVPHSRTHISLLPERAAVYLHMGDERAMIATLVYGLNALDVAEDFCTVHGSYYYQQNSNTIGSAVGLRASSPSFAGGMGSAASPLSLPGSAINNRGGSVGGRGQSVMGSFANNNSLSVTSSPSSPAGGGGTGFVMGGEIVTSLLMFGSPQSSESGGLSATLGREPSQTLCFLHRFKERDYGANDGAEAANNLAEMGMAAITMSPSSPFVITNANPITASAAAAATSGILGLNHTAAHADGDPSGADAIFDGPALSPASPLLQASTYNPLLLALLRCLVFPPLRSSVPGAIESMMPQLTSMSNPGDSMAGRAMRNNTGDTYTRPRRSSQTSLMTPTKAEPSLAVAARTNGRTTGATQATEAASRTFRKRITEALELLERHAGALDPTEVLSLLPSEMPVERISHFLKRTFQANFHKKRLLEVISQCSKAAVFESEVKLSLLKQRCIYLDEDRCCVVCKRPIGDSVFGVFPNLKVAHFPCFKHATLDPERLVPFTRD